MGGNAFEGTKRLTEKEYEKLCKKIQEILVKLPKVDCGICGSPSCKTLAEDIVQGEGTLSQCIFIQRSSDIKAGQVSQFNRDFPFDLIVPNP